MKPIIEVIVSPTGEVVIDAIGFKGADCEQATRYLEQALGSPGQREKKPEHRREVKRQQRIGA
jgi:hypothetical protein